MKNLSLVLILVSFLGITRGGQTVSEVTTCESGWVTLSGHCYRLVTEEVTWTEAVDRCRQMGAEMFGALSANEKEREILELLRGATSGPDGWWVGLRIEEFADANWRLTVVNGVMTLGLIHRDVCGTVQLASGKVQRSFSICTSARPYICETSSMKRDNTSSPGVTMNGLFNSSDLDWLNSTFWPKAAADTQRSGDLGSTAPSLTSNDDVNMIPSASTDDVKRTALPIVSTDHAIIHDTAKTNTPTSTSTPIPMPHPNFMHPTSEISTDTSNTLTWQTKDHHRFTVVTPLRGTASDALPVTGNSYVSASGVYTDDLNPTRGTTVSDESTAEVGGTDGLTSAMSFTDDSSISKASSKVLAGVTSEGFVSRSDDISDKTASPTSLTHDISQNKVSPTSLTDDISQSTVFPTSLTDDMLIANISPTSFANVTFGSSVSSTSNTDDALASTQSTTAIMDDNSNIEVSSVSLAGDISGSMLTATSFTDNTSQIATSSTSSANDNTQISLSLTPVTDSAADGEVPMTSFIVSAADNSVSVTSPQDVTTESDDAFSGSDIDFYTSGDDIFNQTNVTATQTEDLEDDEFRFYRGCYVNVSESDAMRFMTEVRSFYKIGGLSCPQLEVDALLWPETPAGQIATLKCPHGEGFATWKCDDNVTCWRGSPDVTECVLEEIKIKLQTAKLTGQEFNEYATAVVARFLRVTGDQVNTTETLAEAIETMWHIGNLTLDYQLTETTFVTLVDFADRVISTDHQLWDKLNGESLKPSTDLLRGLEQITTNILNSNEAYEKLVDRENIVIQRGEVNDDIYFPPLGHTGSLTSSSHSLYLPYKALGKAYKGVRYVIYHIRNDNQRFKIGKNNLLRGDSVTDGETSDIIAMTIRHHDGSLLSNVTIKYSVNQTDGNAPMCVFLNTSHSGRNVWSTEGCTQKWIHESQVMCKCNHLTNFAVFMSLHQTPDNDPALNIISFVGCVLSIVCLVLTLAVYLVLWRYLKSEKSTLLVHLCISLALGYTIFLAGINRTDNKVMCTIIAALIHYCFLAVFVNFFCQGVALLVSVRSMTSRSFLKHYLVLIYVVPLVVVATTLAVTGATGHGTSNYCWLSTDGGVIWSFIGPALFVLTMNILVLIVVIQSIQSSYGMMDKSIRARSVSVARTLCFLTPIFGLSWVFGILSMSSEEKVFQYLFAFLNSLQGLFIFILQCLVRKQVRDGFVKLKRQIRSRTLTSSSKTLSTDSNVKKSAEVTL